MKESSADREADREHGDIFVGQKAGDGGRRNERRVVHRRSERREVLRGEGRTDGGEIHTKSGGEARRREAVPYGRSGEVSERRKHRIHRANRQSGKNTGISSRTGRDRSRVEQMRRGERGSSHSER